MTYVTGPLDRADDDNVLVVGQLFDKLHNLARDATPG